MTSYLGSLRWRTSSYSPNTANCVEVATPPSEVLVRDTKARQAGHLMIPSQSWERFLTSVK
ncbi:hypothetical protein ALI144C_27230 [Actinosynnema sp. ALI-1.44]|uniref:DUF397 domain-containing protein n=1 Tax=Actinosynnema sp. ALI-1.44 TaxID=1933779 RepID=UPI00097BC00C|nr:DUF397 domain-containing protein [Actinosynnema sp. ALI-1.44]ONI79491.1 hypothetical protein ALI144C_27230 [Actinosynnema sp. ALI-1.44]